MAVRFLRWPCTQQAIQGGCQGVGVERRDEIGICTRVKTDTAVQFIDEYSRCEYDGDMSNFCPDGLEYLYAIHVGQIDVQNNCRGTRGIQKRF